MTSEHPIEIHERFHLRSFCCTAPVYPDAVKKVLYCSKCGRDLGADPHDAAKMTKIPVEEPTARKEHIDNDQNNGSNTPKTA